MTGEINLAQQWLTKAKNDLLNADNNLAARDIPCDTVCFHCQQAAEKMLKAFLVAHAQPYPLTHDLLLLLEHVLPLDQQAEKLRPTLALLNPYAVAVRYPDTAFMPAVEDAREAKAAADDILVWLKTARPDLFVS
ncbi:HEPN domain-containing protein [Planctomycetota bacterium]